jgi:hypothetical protein
MFCSLTALRPSNDFAPNVWFSFSVSSSLAEKKSCEGDK